MILKKLWSHRLLPFRIIKAYYYKIVFGQFGCLSYINNPLRIDGYKRIFIGNRCAIQYKTWLAANPLTGELQNLLSKMAAI